MDRLTTLSAIGSGADEPNLLGWKKKVEAKYPNQVFNIYHMFGIASGQFVVEALKRAGPNLTREAMNKALEGMDIQTDTYAGPLKCSAASHQCHNTLAWFALKDGKAVKVGQTTVTK